LNYLYSHVKGMWVDKVILAGGIERVQGVRREENSRWTLDQSHSDLAVRFHTLHVWSDSLFQSSTHTNTGTHTVKLKRHRTWNSLNLTKVLGKLLSFSRLNVLTAFVP